MTVGIRSWLRGRVVVGGLAALALAAAPLAAPSSAAGAPQPAPGDFPSCPAPVPMADVTEGMTGTGLTVVRGTTPQEFGVEVLGVLNDANGPDRDLIVVQVTDLANGHVIDQAGGIWAGMSGSPVYVGGKLLGAVSYGFTYGTSPIGGVTPAADMLDLLSLGGAAQKPAAADKVALPSALRKKIAATTNAPAPRGTMKRLPLPLAMGGLSSARVQRFQGDADAANLPLVAYNGSGAAAPAADAPMTQPVAGGNFVTALAYGDLSAYATGTTTAVCGDQAVAFGHPFQAAGPVGYGASDGTSLAIIRDDASGAFKLADIGSPIGTIDQDRSAGVRAHLGVAPTGTTITTTVRNNQTGRVRTGTTTALAPDLLPDIAAYAAFANLDAVFDEAGDGRATTHWTINGTRANGKPFTVSRGNRWASRYDISSDPAYDLAYAIDALTSGDTEAVTITSVEMNSRIDTNYKQLRVAKVAVSVNGGKYHSSAVRVKVGSKLKVRTTLKSFRSNATTTEYTSFTVPARARGQYAQLLVTGGEDLASGFDEDEDDLGCLLGVTACDDDGEDSLDAVIKSLTSVSRNDDLVARLSFDGSSKSKSGPSITHEQRLTTVVTGEDSVAISVRR